MAFESGVVPEDRRYAAIVLPYKGRGERAKCGNDRDNGLLSVVGKKNICMDPSRQSKQSD